jgi:hypothetical protein
MSVIYINPYALAAAAGIVTTGLVLHLDAGDATSYPGSGTTWTDLSGNGNTGTLNNGVGYNSANGGYLTFDGSNDYVRVAHSNSVNITSNTTSFGGWVYPTVSNKYQNFVVKNDGAARHYGMFLSGEGTSKIYRVLNGVVAQDNITLSSPWTVNAWNYILLVYNGSTIKIYINGSEVYSASATGNLSGSAYPVHIGYEPNEPYALVGNISQITIYNIALTAAEVTQNFNALRGRYGL